HRATGTPEGRVEEAGVLVNGSDRVPPEQRAELGIGDAMVRLSIGLEDPDDLLDDLTNALKQSGR
ncbi:MAG: PLP-dependent transferase, partial [Actinomycetota bacterium]